MTQPATTRAASQSGARQAMVRALPTALAVVPVSMLFGVLAAQANWSASEVLLFSALGFSGSGQFALLPLAGQGVNVLTMLVMAVSINSRYLPIAFATASRLPRAVAPRAITAHMLGDEAYAVENERDPSSSVMTIRATIYVSWVMSALLGVFVARLIPAAWGAGAINLGFPASVVLLVLSLSQLKARVPRMTAAWRVRIGEIGLCVPVAILLFVCLGRVWFWLPSIGFSAWRMSRMGA